MNPELITFRKFNDTALAEEIAVELRKQGIHAVVENNKPVFDVSFAFNNIEPDQLLKIAPENFTKADEAMYNYYQPLLKTLDNDYYLYSFSNEELMEILSKPDEWGHLDYQLAIMLLKERGAALEDAKLKTLKQNRQHELELQSSLKDEWVNTGYFLSIFGSVIGLFMGLTILYAKTTLPDGSRIYTYDSESRKKGKIMIVLSIVFLLLWLVLRMRFYQP